MVFSEDEEAFNYLLDEMQSTLKGLDYDQVLDYDMECAKAQNDARVAVAEAYETESGSAETDADTETAAEVTEKTEEDSTTKEADSAAEATE